jgi:hypothetical protein
MELLRKAVQNGSTGLDFLKKSEEFDAVRSRVDFKELVAGLAAKKQAGAKSNN